jgi:hypothetical protein
MHRCLWNSKVRHRVHNTTPLVLVMGQMNPVHTLIFFISIFTFHLLLRLPRGLFLSSFSSKMFGGSGVQISTMVSVVLVSHSSKCHDDASN